jgi:hypothetical protein
MLTETLQEVAIAFRQLEFAIRLLSYCELGGIQPSDFDAPHLTQLPNGSLHFPSGSFADETAILSAANINVITALGACFLVLDQAFEAFGINPDPDAADNIVRLRTLIYMVRCSFAHRIGDPRWEVRGKYRRQLVVMLPSKFISLDLQTLNGAAFDIDVIGGYVGLYEMRGLARERFAKHFQ